MLSPKLLNFTTYLLSSSLLIASKLFRGFNTKLFLSHTKHFILVIHLISGHSHISSTLGQLVHHHSSHLVTLLISLVSKSLVDLSTILVLLYGTHFLLIVIRFLTIILRPHLPLLYLLLFSTKKLKAYLFHRSFPP